MIIKMYSTGCPQCKALKNKLDSAGVEYTLIEDSEVATKFAVDHGFSTMPLLQVDDKIMPFGEAYAWVGAQVNA